MHHARLESRSPEDTLAIGRAIGRALSGGERLGIGGDLGAGKTQLVRGLARGLDIDPELIYSPSFTLVAEHEGRLRLNHVDLFRLGDPLKPTEEEEIGLVDILATEGVTAIEWYHKLARPPGAWTLEIEIEVVDEERRRISIGGVSEHAAAILAALRRDLPWA
jgi:tRNA threonylcarbamoyladenosine biosynthesis protein TsaE